MDDRSRSRSRSYYNFDRSFFVSRSMIEKLLKMIFFSEYAYILCQNKLKLYSWNDFIYRGWFFGKKNQINTQKPNFRIIFEKAFFGIFVFDLFWRPYKYLENRNWSSGIAISRSIFFVHDPYPIPIRSDRFGQPSLKLILFHWNIWIIILMWVLIKIRTNGEKKEIFF